VLLKGFTHEKMGQKHPKGDADRGPEPLEAAAVAAFFADHMVLAEEAVSVRKSQMRELVHPTAMEYDDTRLRLRSLMAPGGDRISDSMPLDVQTFENALDTLHEWRAAFVHACVTHFPAQRVQLGDGLCYMHAPLVLQHYLVSTATGADAGTIDMAGMVREGFSGDALTAHIFQGAGGSSVEVLCRLLVPGSVVVEPSVAEWESFLQRHGPGLVSRFSVHSDFVGESLTFDGNVFGPQQGHHAMLLIGARTDVTTDKRWFLLQNWWKSKQFVEVSESYMLSACAKVCFVTTPQTEMPHSELSRHGRYAESAHVDVAEVIPTPTPCWPPRETETVPMPEEATLLAYLDSLDLYRLRLFARSNRCKVRLDVGGFQRRTKKDIINDVMKALHSGTTICRVMPLKCL